MCVYELGMSLGIWPTFCQSHGLGVSTLSCGAQAQVWFVQLPKQISEDYNGQAGLLRGLSVLLCPASKNFTPPE